MQNGYGIKSDEWKRYNNLISFLVQEDYPHIPAFFSSPSPKVHQNESYTKPCVLSSQMNNGCLFLKAKFYLYSKLGPRTGLFWEFGSHAQPCVGPTFPALTSVDVGPGFNFFRIKEPSVMGIWKNKNQRTTNFSYFKQLKEPSQELTVFWVIYLMFSKTWELTQHVKNRVHIGFFHNQGHEP